MNKYYSNDSSSSQVVYKFYSIKELPSNWALTPVQNKKPYRRNWQKESLLSVQTILDEISREKGNGIGLRTGDISGGILAIDLDGQSAHELFEHIRGDNDLPTTVSFTSGRFGRKQLLFQIPNEFRDRLKKFNKKTIKEINGFKCRKVFDELKGEEVQEQLELRYNGMQSVLPPSYHPDTKQPYQWINSPNNVDVGDCPYWLIEVILGEIEPTPNHGSHYDKYLSELTLPINDTIPLEICLARTSRELLNGVSQGDRNNSGYRLAADLIGTANYLESIGQAYEGMPEQLFDEFCSKCTPPLDSREQEQIFKSASQGGSKPCLGEDKIKNCIAGWYWKNSDVKRIYQRGNNRTYHNRNKSKSKGGCLDTQEKLNLAFLEVDKLIQLNLSTSELEKKLMEISAEYSIAYNQIKNYYRVKGKEETDQDTQLELTNDFSNILKIEKTDLPLLEILPPDLANMLNQLAENMRVEPEHLFTALLPVWASAIGTKSKIIIKSDAGYVQPSIIRSMIVAHSGERKSPILNVVTDFLQRLEYEENQRLQAEYKLELADYNQLVEKGEKNLPPEPIEPPEFRLLLKDSNHDGLVRIHSENPAGLMMLVDELAGYFTRMNKQQATGRGDDEQKDLELFNGKSIRKDRMGKQFSYHVPKTSVSITGSIQWEVLSRLFNSKDGDDSAGTFCRWLICAKPLPPAYLDLSTDNQAFFDDYEGKQIYLYQYLRDSLDEGDYILSDDAKKYWQQFQHWLIDMQRRESNEALRIAYSKFESYLSRIALVLHCVHSYYSPDYISPAISGEIIQIATKVVVWFMGQYRLVLARIERNNKESGLTADILRARDLLLRKGELTPRTLRTFLHKNKKQLPDDIIKQYFATLVQSDYATYSNSKRTLKIIAQLSAATSAAKCSNPDFNTHKGLIDKCSKVQHKCSNIKTSSSMDLTPKCSKIDEKHFSSDHLAGVTHSEGQPKYTEQTDNLDNSDPHGCAAERPKTQSGQDVEPAALPAALDDKENQKKVEKKSEKVEQVVAQSDEPQEGNDETDGETHENQPEQTQAPKLGDRVKSVDELVAQHLYYVAELEGTNCEYMFLLKIDGDHLTFSDKDSFWLTEGSLENLKIYHVKAVINHSL